MSRRKSDLMFFILWFTSIILFTFGVDLAYGNEKVKEETGNLPAADLTINAGIVPMPGDDVGITVKFHRPMTHDSRPKAELTIGNGQPQNFTQGKMQRQAMWAKA